MQLPVSPVKQHNTCHTQQEDKAAHTHKLILSSYLFHHVALVVYFSKQKENTKDRQKTTKREDLKSEPKNKIQKNKTNL